MFAAILNMRLSTEIIYVYRYTIFISQNTTLHSTPSICRLTATAASTTYTRRVHTSHSTLSIFRSGISTLSVLYLAIDPRSGHLIYVYVKVNVFLNIIISFIAALNVDFALHQIP